MNNVSVSIIYQGMILKGYASPFKYSQDSLPASLLVYIQGRCIGTIYYSDHKWTMDQPIDSKFVDALGSYIHCYVRSVADAEI